MSPPRASSLPPVLEAPHHLSSGAAVAAPSAPSIASSSSQVTSSNNSVPYSLMFSPIPLSRDYATHKQMSMERMVTAVNNGDLTLFQQSIEDGADVHSNLPGGLGYTVLHRAAAMGHINIVNYLLSPSCSHLRVAINQQDIQGWTPLMRACKSGHSDIVTLLVERRANTHIRNQAGQNALGIAALSNNILAIDILTSRKSHFLFMFALFVGY
jgi:ankyrin repeat protein